VPVSVSVPVGDGPYRQDAYATSLTPRSYVADAESSIGFQPVLCGCSTPRWGPLLLSKPATPTDPSKARLSSHLGRSLANTALTFSGSK